MFAEIGFYQFYRFRCYQAQEIKVGGIEFFPCIGHYLRTFLISIYYSPVSIDKNHVGRSLGKASEFFFAFLKLLFRPLALGYIN